MQSLLDHCDFKTFYDKALRDSFVAGIRNKETKKVLLTLSGKEEFVAVVEKAKREELVQSASGKMNVREASGVNRGNYSGSVSQGRNRGRNSNRSAKERVHK